MKMSSFEATTLSMDRLRNIFSYVCLRGASSAPGGSPPTGTSPASWTVTPQSLANSSNYVSWNCVDTSCRQLVITTTSQPDSCALITVQATLVGASSPVYTATVDWPNATNLVARWTRALCLPCCRFCPATRYRLCQPVEVPFQIWFCMRNFLVPGMLAPIISDWTDPIPQQSNSPLQPGWSAWVTDPSGRFVDIIGYSCPSPDCTPAATVPGTLTGGAQANASASVFFFMRSADTTNLV